MHGCAEDSVWLTSAASIPVATQCCHCAQLIALKKAPQRRPSDKPVRMCAFWVPVTLTRSVKPFDASFDVVRRPQYSCLG